MSLDSYLDGLKQQDEQINGVAATLDAASRYNPDQMATYNRLAKTTKIDPLRMAEDPEVAAAAESRAKASSFDLDSLIDSHPFSAKALGHLPTASLTHDDLGGLQHTEAAMSFLGRSYAAGGGVLGAMGFKLAGGVLSGLGVVTSDEEAAVLFRNDPEGLKRFQEDSTTGWFSRMAKDWNEASGEIMKAATPEAQTLYGGLEYATTDTDKAAYLSPVKMVGDALRNLPPMLATAGTVFLVKGAANTAARDTAARAAEMGLSQAETQVMVRIATKEAAAKAGAIYGATTEGSVVYAQTALSTAEELDKLDVTQNEKYQELIASGYAPEAASLAVKEALAERAGVFAGIASAAVNATAGKFLGELFSSAGGRLRVAGGVAASEGVTEAVQSPLEQLSQNFAVREVDPSRELTEGLLESAIAGGVLGGLTGGAIGAISGPAVDATQKAQRAEQLHQNLSELSQAAAASKLRERGPDQFKVFMQEMADDSGLEALYVDASVLQEAVNQLPPEAQKALHENIPDLRSQLTEGVNTDGMVRINTGDYATHIAGTDLDAVVLPAARVEPEGYTFAEAQEHFAGEGEAMQQAAVSAAEEELQAQAQQEEAQQVKQLVLDQLTSAARYRPEVNEKMAELRKAWYVNRAAALGMKPTELYALMPSTTVGPDEAPIDTLEQPAASPRAQALLREADAEEATAAKRVRTGDPQLAEGHKAKAAELRAQAEVAQREDEAVAAQARDARDAKLASSNYGYRQRDAARVATPDALKTGNVKDLLRMKDWTILTAENPAAQALSPEENAARNEELKAELTKRGLQFEEVKGKYGANEENSIAVFGISREDASALGQMFGQESVLTRDGLVFPDNTVIPARKVETFDIAPDDYYTRVPSTGAVFSVNLDFDKRVPLSEGRLGEVKVEGTHFSRSARMVLDGAAHGTGMKGEEAARVNQPAVDSRLKKRLYFYVDEGQGVTPESGVGSERHDLVLTNLYDLAKNPLGISTADSNAMEAAILDAGFDGYYAPKRFNTQGAAVLLGQATKGVVVDLPPEGKLFQEIGDKARGFFDPKTWTTGLLKNADLSTYLHETGHFFLEAEAALADSPNAPQKVKDDFNKALNWLGVADVATWNSMSLEQKRPYHEKYARGFEAYLMEGKAPSQELKSLFREFASWLTHIYKQLRNLNVELSDEVRGVFDRMLASEEAILAAEQARGYEALLLGGATEVEAAAYVQQGEEATRVSIEKLQQRSLRDMKWLSNKRAGVVRGLNREARDARKAVKAEVVAEVMGEPVNQAVTFLRRGEYTDKFTGEKLKADGAFRLDRAVLAEMGYRADELPGMTSDNGLHPDAIASRFGFGSSEAMLSAILNREDVGAKIEGMTDQRMLERHGDLYDERAIAAAADDAIHNEARAKFMATGLKMAMKSPLPVSQIKKAAKSAAAEVIAAKRVSALRPAEYTAAEARANKAALKAAPKGPEEAQRALRSALLNNQLARATMDAKAEVEAGVARMKRLQKGPAQSNMRGDYLDQLNALLARYDLRTSTKAIPAERQAARQELRDWINTKAEENDAVVPDIPEWVLREADRRSYKELTVGEFRGLMDTVKGIEMLARREEKQYQAIRGMQFAEERRAVLDRIREFNPEAFDSTGEPTGMSPVFVKHIGDKWDDLKDSLAGQLLNSEHIINLLEGGEFGVVNESLFGRMSKAADWKATRLAGVMAKTDPLMKQYSYIERQQFSSKDITTDEIRKAIPGGLTRENALVVTLLHGSKDGRERLANYGWDESLQQKIVDLLDERDVNLANGIWELFDNDLWPELEALNKRTRGKAPPKVEAVPHQAKGGALRGGYFRLKYDTNLDERAHRMDEVSSVRELAGGTLGQGAKTAQGTSTERKQNVTMRPRLDLGVFAETMSETVHDLAYREAVMDTMRLMNDKGIQNTIKKVAGVKAYRALVQHVRDVAAPPRNPSSFIGKFAAVARKNTVITLMSGVSTALLNVTGFSPAARRVSKGRLVKEVAQFYSTEMRSKVDTANQLSDYMRNRSQSFERDLQDQVKQMTVDKRWLPLPDTGTFLVLMTYVDKGVSYPVWHAAFADGMEKFANDREQAVQYADHIVRQTQGSGRHVDLAAMQSGHGEWGNLKKLFTMFYSYANSQLGLLVRSGAVSKQLAKKSRVAASANFAKDVLAVVLVPSIMTALLKDAITGAGEDDEPEDTAKKIAWETTRYGLGMVPILRDVAPAVIATLVDDEAVPFYGYKMSPAQFYVEAPMRALNAAQDVGEGTADDKDERALIMGTSVFIGLPGKLIADTWLGLNALIEGEAGPEAVLFGPPKK